MGTLVAKLDCFFEIAVLCRILLAVLGAMHNVSYPSSSSAGSQVVIGESHVIIPRELSVLILQVSM